MANGTDLASQAIDSTPVNGTDILDKVVGSTTSEIVLIAVIVAVVIILVGIPIYRLVIKSAEKRRQQYIDRETKLIEALNSSADRRESQLIQVIERNSEVITELKTLFNASNDKCDVCRREQKDQFWELKRGQEEATKILYDINRKVGGDKG